jgi:hypothetical protein
MGTPPAGDTGSTMKSSSIPAHELEPVLTKKLEGGVAALCVASTLSFACVLIS